MNSVALNNDNTMLLNFSASIHPVLSGSYFLEEVFDWIAVYFWVRSNFYVSVLFSIGYLAAFPALMSFMSNRRPMKLKNSLTVWNTALASFSILGMYRIVPSVLRDFFYYGPHRIICMGR